MLLELWDTPMDRGEDGEEQEAIKKNDETVLMESAAEGLEVV